MIEDGIDEPGSPTKFESVRLPNKVVKQLKDIGDSTVHMSTQEIQSPTSFLRGGLSVPVDNFFTNDDKASV